MTDYYPIRRSSRKSKTELKVLVLVFPLVFFFFFFKLLPSSGMTFCDPFCFTVRRKEAH